MADDNPDVVKQEETAEGKTGFQLHPENINRKGRPPLGQSMTDLMREFLAGVDPKSIEGLTRKEQLIQRIGMLAYAGDFNAIKLIWNYLDGMPAQKIFTSDIEDLKDIPYDELIRVLNERNTEGSDTQES